MGQLAEQLPGYELGELLYDGSTSAVYRARRTADGTRVIVKRTRGPTVSARQLTRYRNEYELLKALPCDGVIEAHELVRSHGQLALVLEHFDGPSLKQWIRTARAPLAERLELAIQLAATLGEVHAAGIIHKDINSHNFLYDPGTRRTKLIDFGIATRLRSEEGKFRFPTALEGTLAYIAPEQTGRMNHSIDYRADWYSLGVTLYELFSGRVPHESDDPLELVHFHIAGKPAPLADVAAGIPQPVSDIVMKLLQKAPEDRYQSAAGLCADLRRCLDQLRSGGRIARFELGSDDVSDRFEPPQRLYGREAETRMLLDTFARIAAGGVEAVLVAGGAGVGKTSLVQEIHQPITARRGYFAAGKFDQLQRDIPFSALVAALQDLVEQLLTESEESVEAWRRAIQDAVGVNGQVIVDVVPALELIIGPQPKVPPLPGFEARNRFKLVFERFIQVFAKRSHPLVLFLDDLQWADSASLNLVTLLLAAPATESLLVVAAYRDNEVTAAHPFMLTVKELGNRGVHVGSIELAPLTSGDIAQLVANTLHRDVAAATPLAEVIFRKTAGNPFFIRQFLQSLHVEKLIAFDPGTRTFRYDIASIEAAAITENVAELLSAKLDRLPAETREVLRLAAAIGGRFDLETLAIIHGRPAAEVARLLDPALADGLIVPASRLESLDTDALDSPLVYRRFAFLHDRVQRAAYDMVEPDERPALHLAIGRVLLDASSAEELEQRLFDIVTHMNQGEALIEDRTERRSLAEFNLRAGTKARNSTAYRLAVRSYRHALALLDGDDTSKADALRSELRMKLAEALCLTADYAGAFDLIDRALEHAANATERTRLHALKVVTYLSMGRMPEALEWGRRAAEERGLELPADPESALALLESEVAAILSRTQSIGIEKLLELPVMSDDDTVALMALLTHCLPAAYQCNQQLFALICSKMVSLSLEHGNCALSARAYGSFGGLLSSVHGRYRDAYRFTKLAVDLVQRLDDPSVYAGAYFLWAMFASHWNEPIDESIKLFERSVQHGLETGDHLHAGYSAARRVSHLQFRGMPLGEAIAEASAAVELLHRMGDDPNIAFLEPRIRFMRWLRGERPSGNTLGTDDEDEAACTATIRSRQNYSFEGDWFMLLARQRYLCGELEEAYALGREADRLLPYSAGFVTRVEHTFYRALTAAALHRTRDPEARTELEDAVETRRAALAAWAESCPANYGPMHRLVEAEAARMRGAHLDAMQAYDDAIASAAEQGFVHIEALAAELAARYWFEEHAKPDFGSLYLDRALHAYEIWGADGKAADLLEAYGLTARRTPGRSVTADGTTLGSSVDRDDALDLATVLKASQAISGEIVLERLLGKLMDIILENAGAETGVLVLENRGEYLVQGVKERPSEPARVMVGEPLKSCDRLSQGIVHYVIRTSESIVLSDPALRGKFRADVHVRERRPKSVLCAPLAHKGRLTGVIYLENNQVAGAFTPARLEALNVLTAQIAVSIENATLYARQEQQARSIEIANEALTREISERKHAEQELSRYKDHLEELVAQRTRELQSAQGRLVDLSRRAGMAEVASGVLHNVGNVMNSVNVGAHVVRDALKSLSVERLANVCALLEQNADRLGAYLEEDPAGRRIPEYLAKLSDALAADKARIRAEIDQVLEHLEHMKKIIAAQQSYAKVNGVTEVCTLQEIAETALAISEAALRGSGVRVVRRYDDLPPALLDRHQIMQILVNLISNAKHALEEKGADERVLEIVIAADGSSGRIEVRDNGIGIAPENIGKIFNHGFTTKKTGHGFGLHNCANAAQQMEGRLDAFSAGRGHGARFVLRLPLPSPDRSAPRSETA